MYLELSPRQTGKSTRLIDAALEAAVISKHVLVVAPNETSTSRLVQKVINHPLKNFKEFISFSTTFESGYDQYFIDDFDGLSWDKWENHFNNNEWEGSYYTSTPNFIRHYDVTGKMRLYGNLLNIKDDPLFKLLEHNNQQYISYAVTVKSGILQPVYRKLAANHKQILCEYEGIF